MSDRRPSEFKLSSTTLPDPDGLLKEETRPGLLLLCMNEFVNLFLVKTSILLVSSNFCAVKITHYTVSATANASPSIGAYLDSASCVNLLPTNVSDLPAWFAAEQIVGRAGAMFLEQPIANTMS